MHRRPSLAAALLLTLAFALRASSAFAAPREVPHATLFARYWSFDVDAITVRRTPALSFEGAIVATADSRRYPHGPIGARPGYTAIGLSVDYGFTFDDSLIVPLLGGGVAFAAGTYESRTIDVDGAIGSASADRAVMFRVFLPGLGVRAKRGRTMFEASLRGEYDRVTVEASYARGAESVSFPVRGDSLVLLGDASVCSRLDPTTRLCFAVQPRLYDSGWLGGVGFALRYEGDGAS